MEIDVIVPPAILNIVVLFGEYIWLAPVQDPPILVLNKNIPTASELPKFT